MGYKFVSNIKGINQDFRNFSDLNPKPNYFTFMSKILLIALFPLLFIVGCKKDEPEAVNDSEKAGPVTEKQLVKTITMIISGKGVAKTNYNYNSKNRITSVHDSALISDDYFYTYDDAGNMIQEVFSREGNSITRDYKFVNNAPVSCTYTSPAFPQDNFFMKIITDETKVISATYYTLSASPKPVQIEGATSKYEYQNQNLVKVSSSFPDRPTEILATNIYEYGTQKSPFLYSGDRWKQIVSANKNDQLKDMYISGSSSVTTVTYSNTYNNQGYPIKVIANAKQVADDLPNPIISQYTKIYTYIDAK
jgi:hypothetical protein